MSPSTRSRRTSSAEENRDATMRRISPLVGGGDRGGRRFLPPTTTPPPPPPSRPLLPRSSTSDVRRARETTRILPSYRSRMTRSSGNTSDRIISVAARRLSSTLLDISSTSSTSKSKSRSSHQRVVTCPISIVVVVLLLPLLLLLLLPSIPNIPSSCVVNTSRRGGRSSVVDEDEEKDEDVDMEGGTSPTTRQTFDMPDSYVSAIIGRRFKSTDVSVTSRDPNPTSRRVRSMSSHDSSVS